MSAVYTSIETCPPASSHRSNIRPDPNRLSPSFLVFQKEFHDILGAAPKLEVIIEDDWPFAHEAGVLDATQDAFFITSNQISCEKPNRKIIHISKVKRDADGTWSRQIIDTNIPFANGGTNWSGGIVICAQGSETEPPGLCHMRSQAPYSTRYLLSSYHGRPFNSPNDVIVHSDGSIWFTDPIYGYEQNIRPTPQLPSQVYRFDPAVGDLRVVADGFGRPNGLAFSPDEQTLYVTDTDWIHGDGSRDDQRVSSMLVRPSLLRSYLSTSVNLIRDSNFRVY